MAQLGDCPATPVSLSSATVSVAYNDDVKCQFIYEGFCPAGYYCPPGYNDAMLADSSIAEVLNQSSCVYGSRAEALTKTSTLPVVCPCTPGFYCSENTSIPIRCIQGYLCPTDTSVTETAFGDDIGPDGLGTWGRLSENCPEGKWCGSGQVVAFNCNSLTDCPENSITRANTFAWILLVIFMGVIATGFYFLRWKQSTEKHDQKRQVEQMREVAQTAKVGTEETISPSKALGEAYEVEFKDINLTLPNGTKIMKGVNGKFSPGRLCAIMGSSGAGKTTIINLVTGKVPKTSGQIYVNGVEKKGLTYLRKVTGFVPQEDTMIRSLTVRENIEFSAKYRLDASTSAADLDATVNETLLDLGIDHVQHTIIGDEMTRGISGGQRKRCNIGLELVALPQIIFLDEPTSGLDSTTTTALCKTLKKIALKKQLTIVSVIHQPSMSSFLEFDDLLLLGKGGQVVYHGPLDEAPDYFARIGFPVPAKCNPSDFYLDVISAEVPRQGFPDFKRTDLFQLWEQYRTTGKVDGPLSSEEEEVHQTTKEPSSLSEKVQLMFFAFVGLFHKFIFDTFTSWKNYFGEIAFLISEMFSCKTDQFRTTPSIVTQFWMLFVRSCKQNYRGLIPFLQESMVHFVLGIVLGFAGTGIWVQGMPSPYCQTLGVKLQSSCEQPPGAQADFQTKGLYCAFGITFAGVAMAAGTFGNEIPNYWREAQSGLYTIAYFYAKLLADIPRIVSAAFFFWAAFNNSFDVTGDPGRLFGVVLMMYFFGFQLGYFASQVASGAMIPVVGVMFALIFCAVFSGLSPTLGEVRRDGDSTLLYNLSGPRWTIEAFYLTSVEYYEELPADSGYEGQPYSDLGPQLYFYGYYLSNFATDMWASILSGLFWSFIAFLVMASTSLEKKK